MIIMGVDPGTAVSGYGIVEKTRGDAVHVTSGVVRTAPGVAHSKRISEIHRRLEEVVASSRPDVMVVESLFHARNAQSLMKLCQVRGAVLLLGEVHGMTIVEYTPMEIKKGLTGYGRADKKQMVFMVSRLLGLPQLTSPDEADALAMALYHSHHGPARRAVP
jgi:crossover junction endodeoxyribonuclease RuvC